MSASITSSVGALVLAARAANARCSAARTPGAAAGMLAGGPPRGNATDWPPKALKGSGRGSAGWLVMNSVMCRLSAGVACGFMPARATFPADLKPRHTYHHLALQNPGAVRVCSPAVRPYNLTGDIVWLPIGSVFP